MTTFDPETQSFVTASNGTQIIAPSTSWAEMSGFTVLRDFINNALGRKTQRPFGQKDEKASSSESKEWDEDDDSLS